MMAFKPDLASEAKNDLFVIVKIDFVEYKGGHALWLRADTDQVSVLLLRLMPQKIKVDEKLGIEVRRF